MVVVIRDGHNVIRANLADDDHEILQVEHEADGNQTAGTCNITQSENSLQYFKVRLNRVSWQQHTTPFMQTLCRKHHKVIIYFHYFSPLRMTI